MKCQIHRRRKGSGTGQETGAADDCSDLTSLLTPIGCGIAGYTDAQIAPLFARASDIPNIHLPAEFWLVLSSEGRSFYILVICATTENPNGVYLHKELDNGCRTQHQYEEIYRRLSVRDDSECPNIRFSETRRPIKSRITKQIDKHEYLTERDLYQLASSQHRLFVVLNPSNVFVLGRIENKLIDKPLKESKLYSAFLSK